MAAWIFDLDNTLHDAYGFLRLMRRNRLAACQCIMVEDSLENLRTAKKLGMRTVWVSREHNAPACVDVTVRSLRALQRAAVSF